ncbi:hypothetical protein KKG90_03825 [Candidatus Bipolaricaulota bacterium]|nr:hypothetical protein [Candidatus Bipolaricaulota bacterium]
MNTTKMLAWGSMLATIGALGIILLLMLDWFFSSRVAPFVIGFCFGLPAGVGSALCILGLVRRRNASQ